uniref:Uncharacterized protein n=1 Tax=Lepeophtheirus salmonis TaxID=72036 RepID=A0A0K2UTM8_LEPSM
MRSTHLICPSFASRHFSSYSRMIHHFSPMYFLYYATERESKRSNMQHIALYYTLSSETRCTLEQEIVVVFVSKLYCSLVLVDMGL